MNVEMGYALTHAVIYGDEGSLGLHGLLHTFGQQLSIGEERSNKIGGQINECLVMSFWNQNAVPRE